MSLTAHVDFINDVDTLKAKIRYLEAQNARLKHENYALISQTQEMLLLKELKAKKCQT